MLLRLMYRVIRAHFCPVVVANGFLPFLPSQLCPWVEHRPVNVWSFEK